MYLSVVFHNGAEDRGHEIPSYHAHGMITGDMIATPGLCCHLLKKDSVHTTQKCCVVYEFLCRCEARYVGRTTLRLADRIKQHVPTSIRKNSYTVREQPPRISRKKNSKINGVTAIGQQLVTNPECAKAYADDNFRVIGQ